MGIAIPLDKICVKSGLLCPRCSGLIERGEYEEWEVEVMKALLEYEKGLKDVDIEYKKSYIVDDALIIMVSVRRGRLPSWLGRRLSGLASNLGTSKVLIVEYSRDLRELASSILYPARVYKVDEIYEPDGSTYLLVKVVQGGRRVSRAREELVKKIISNITGKNVVIEYVRGAPGVLVEDIDIEKPDIRKSLDKLGI
ncbi:MAG: hypothetical protein GSR85_05560 [Desulfurococcales archaeon]|nr:hypothetical protein [Desulfurococcales archaeon]